MLTLLTEKKHLLSHIVSSSSYRQPAAVPSAPEASILVIRAHKRSVFSFPWVALVEQDQVFCLSADSFSAQAFVKASAEEDRSLGSLKPVKISGSPLMNFAQYKGWSAKEDVVSFIFFFFSPQLVRPGLLDTPPVKGWGGFAISSSGRCAHKRSVTIHWTHLQTLQT